MRTLCVSEPNDRGRSRKLFLLKRWDRTVGHRAGYTHVKGHSRNRVDELLVGFCSAFHANQG